MQELKNTHFQKVLGDYSLKQNRQALVKRLSCSQKRKNRSSKSLDPEQMEAHAAHFASTFGRDPEGEQLEEVAEETDPGWDKRKSLFCQQFFFLFFTENNGTKAFRSTKAGQQNIFGKSIYRGL
jgi:hypothetical protein